MDAAFFFEGLVVISGCDIGDLAHLAEVVIEAIEELRDGGRLHSIALGDGANLHIEASAGIGMLIGAAELDLTHADLLRNRAASPEG